MLYEAIRLGCERFHASVRSYDDTYKSYREDREPARWDEPESLEFRDADRLVKFANQWAAI